jgi:two-component system, NarL family, nitrate/nitrite response regulator NarL
MATVVLGDDHVVFLDALSTVLSEQGHLVCGVARSAAEMVTLVAVHQPDACLIDHNAPEGEDAETIRRVLAACAGTSVIVLGASSRGDAVSRALDAGATGYLHQSRGLGALVSALERVLDGETVIDVPDAPSARRSAEPNLELRMASHLTSRERECLMMLVEGLDTAAMVELLGVSRTTVRTHLQSVLTKLGVHSRLEAASFAVRHRLPDLWSTEMPAAAVGAVRPNPVRPSAMRPSAVRPAAAGTPGLLQPTGTVRPIRPRRVEEMRERATQQDLPVAAGQGVSAG